MATVCTALNKQAGQHRGFASPDGAFPNVAVSSLPHSLVCVSSPAVAERWSWGKLQRPLSSLTTQAPNLPPADLRRGSDGRACDENPVRGAEMVAGAGQADASTQSPPSC